MTNKFKIILSDISKVYIARVWSEIFKWKGSGKSHSKRVAKNIKQIQMHPRGRHSAKPLVIKDEIAKLMGDLPRIELFAREKTEGWTALGLDIDGKDIRESLREIINK